MSTIDKRREILFLYETKDCNPNGDPLDENRPRMDPDTEQALVTDVRIKRTIRDYLYHVKGKDILVRDTFDKQGFLNTAKGRAQSLEDEAGWTKDDKIPEAREKLEKTILSKFIDARMFGAALPFTPPGKKGKEASVQITGPVQFSGFSRSLHMVSPQLIQGTAGFASKDGDIQKSFREDYLLPYACIAVYGIVNEIAARTTQLSENDVYLLMEGLWKGTESLITRSKIGHRPLFMMELTHRNMEVIGDLPGLISLESDVDDLEIRGLNQYIINASSLIDTLVSCIGELEAIKIHAHSKLVFKYGEEKGTFAEVSNGVINVEEMW